MRFLAHIALALVVQTGGQLTAFEGEPRARWVPLLLLLPYAMVALAQRGGVSGHFRFAATIGRLAHFGGVLAYAIAVFAFGWVDAVRQWSGQELLFDQWPEWGLILTFAPFVVYQLAAMHAESVAMRRYGAKVWRSFLFQSRMFASALAPLLIWVLVSIGLAESEVLKVNIESVRLIEGAYTVCMLVLFVGLMPFLLTSTWETNPLPPGQARDLLARVADRANFRSREVLLWNTGDTMANAAIVGISARNRVVLLSDALLSMLGERELACVYGHEIGHSKRHHVPIYLSWATFFLLGGALLAELLFPNSEWIAMGLVSAFLVLGYVCFGWMSRRFELEADLYSIELTGDAEALIQALERVAGGSRDRGGWRHFSTAKRVEFLHRANFDVVFRMRFLRRIRTLGKAGFVLGALVLSLYVSTLFMHYGQDRLHAKLALGSYSNQWTELTSEEQTDPTLRESLQLAGRLANEDGSRVPVERIESALQDHLLDGNFEQAKGYARLLAHRNVKDGYSLWAQLDATGTPPPLDSKLEDWPLRWRTFGLDGLQVLKNEERPLR